MQEAERLKLVGASERSGVDRPEAAVLGELLDRAPGLVVIGGEEDVERLVGNLPFRERARERGVEGLDHLRPRHLGR